MALEKQASCIVVGIDGEGHADHAVRAAFELGRKLDAEIELVHAAELPRHLWSQVGEAELAAAREAALPRLAAHLIEAGFPEPGLAERLSVVQGPPAHALLARAKERRASMLVLGRHEKHGLFDFGDTVRAVLASAECPVWVQAGPYREIRRILVPLDLSEESLQALRQARDLARVFGAEITALHCFVRPELGFVLGYPIPFPTTIVDSSRDTAQSEFAKTMEAFDWQGVAHKQSFVEADPALEIGEDQASSDLIVMGTHGRTGLSGAILGSVAASVLRDATVPVLAIRLASRAWLT
jgi:nucleotide-binding universal stress UspA family protein